ncbi:hypothetical protein JCM6882_004801 [Rhodosporidiobolus microsporus]
MGRVRPERHTKPPKPPPPPPSPPPQEQQQQEQEQPLDPQIHRLSASLAAPPSYPLSPYSEADLALFHPSQETVNFLYSLPLPPGVDQQPLPQSSEDWALVEKFRWLCQGLVLAGEYERERRRRIERGEDPYADWEEWDPRQSGNPLVASAVQSLLNSHTPTHPHPHYALSYPHPPPAAHHYPSYPTAHHHAQQHYAPYPAELEYDGLPTHFGGLPIDYGFAGDPEDEDDDGEYVDEPFEGEEEEQDERILSEHSYSFPSLSSLQSFAASASPLDPTALPLSLDLSALTSSLGPTGLGELAAAAGVSVEGLSAAMNGQLGAAVAGEGGALALGGGEGGANPASLPSLIAAIAELEQCVARLSLEATEARNLQKSLRDEMATRQTLSSAPTSSSAAQAKQSKSDAVAATLARAGLKPMKRKVKGGRVVSVSSRSRLPPAAPSPAPAPAAPAPAPARAPPLPAPVPPAAAANGSAPLEHGAHHHDGAHEHHHHHHHCSDCGESLSSHSAHSGSPPPSPPPPPPPAPPGAALPSLPASASTGNAPLANGDAALLEEAGVSVGAVSGTDPKQWEDGELMKALQSVSMLDRRADEYRERLRVLKEQIHHHAALADALAAPQAQAQAQLQAQVAGGAPHAALTAAEQQHLQAQALAQEEQERKKQPFGQSVSDTSLEFVAVSDYRRRQLARVQAEAEAGGFAVALQGADAADAPAAQPAASGQ